MANKKTTKAKKSIATIKQKKEPKPVVVQNTETLFPASKIVKMLGIPDFDYFIMKKEYDLDNGALFTVSDFKKMYKKAIEGR